MHLSPFSRLFSLLSLLVLGAGCGLGDSLRTASEIYDEETLTADEVEVPEGVPWEDPPPVYFDTLPPEFLAEPAVANSLIPRNTPMSVGRNEVLGANLLHPLSGTTLTGVEVGKLPDPPEHSAFAVRVENQEPTQAGFQLRAETAFSLVPGTYEVVCRVYSEAPLGPLMLDLRALEGRPLRVTHPELWVKDEGGWSTFTTGLEVPERAAGSYVPRLSIDAAGPATWYVDFMSIYPVE